LAKLAPDTIFCVDNMQNATDLDAARDGEAHAPGGDR
jgi:hypothetical protein